MLAFLATPNSTSAPTMTYAGASMVLMESLASNAPSLYLFRLDNPATGSNNLVANWTTSARSTIGFITFTGGGYLITQTPDKAVVSGGTSNVTTTLSLAATDIMVGFIAYNFEQTSLAVVTGTQRAEDGTPSNNSAGIATNAGTGSTSITWSRADSAGAAYIGVRMSEPVNATINPTLLSATLSIQTPVVTGTAAVSPTLLTLALSLNSPTATITAHDWSNASKNAASFSNTSKNVETFTNVSKNNSSWTNTQKS